MVSDLNFKSHPDKPLEEHICGVITKSCKYSSLPIVEVSALFHDLGKINPNFQKKLCGNSVNGYSRHSYLSVLSFFYFLKANEEEAFKILKAENKLDFGIKVLQIISLIAYHHSDLPDFEFLPNMDEVSTAANFAIIQELPFSDFLIEKLNKTLNEFSINYVENEFIGIGKYKVYKHSKQWQTDALNYFMDTQFAFASLINADKRDAGTNEYYQVEHKIQESIATINYALTNTFNKYNKANNPSDLNIIRTAIRVEATKNIAHEISEGRRVFTLTAPTGAGKTFTLLSVAMEIQRQKGKLGIIYALPFLSITEQVQKILQEELGIDYLPINSKAQNNDIKTAQFNYELNPIKENLKKILQQDFFEQSFDHPFIVTTFVQLFETLVSNNNATLLKLPNFSNRIFLIDEVQSLPPRLYIFFSAWIEAFCYKHNSYAILSTATMPQLNFPIKDSIYDEQKKPELLFKEYNNNLPKELIDFKRYFSAGVFNRYKINLIDNNNFRIHDLALHIQKQTQSCLIILNTIADTKMLFEELGTTINKILLNTHFIPVDRNIKIEKAKTYLKGKEKVLLITTQLIEAGVDIDFPIVYRDLCPLPSLIQSAGRCNRNKTIEFGQVYSFQLKNESGRSSSEIIYTKEANEFLNFCRNEILDGIEENQLLGVQSRFFDFIKNNLSIGDFEYGHEHKANMIECVNKAEFERLGHFQLINNEIFGEQYRYYIPKDNNDLAYEDIVGLMHQSLKTKNYDEMMKKKIAINNGLKNLNERILNIRINSNKNQIPPAYRNNDEYFDIRVLSDLDMYSFETGLKLGNENLFL